jgi:transposase
MTISEHTLKTSADEPVRRFEVFTGAGRRRDWSDDDKARIVAESYEPGATSYVARPSRCRRYQPPCSCRQ